MENFLKFIEHAPFLYVGWTMIIYWLGYSVGLLAHSQKQQREVKVQKRE